MTNIIDRLKAEGVLGMYLDFRSGGYLDLSGNDNTGAPTDITLGYNGAEFDGSTSVVTVADDATLKGDTGCLVVVSDAMVDEVQHLFDKASQFDLSVPSVGVLEISAGIRAELETTSSGLVDILVKGNNGKKLYINWGDGTEEEYTLLGTTTDVNMTHTYSTGALKKIYFSGDLGDVTWIDLSVGGFGDSTLSGDINDLLNVLPSLSYVFMQNCNFSGDVSTLLGWSLLWCFLHNNTDIYGDASIFNVSSMQRLNIYDTGCTLDIPDMPLTTGMAFLNSQEQVVTCSSQSVPAWGNASNDFSNCGMSTTDIDNYLIGLEVHGLTPGSTKTNKLIGRNSPGTSASDAALAALNSRNYGFQTNKTTNILAVEGDSISITQSWPQYMSGTVWSAGQEINFALAGDKATLMPAQYPSQAGLTKPYQPNGKRGDFFLLAGTNDLATGDTAVNVFVALSTLWADSRADNYNVIAMEVLPSEALTGSEETERLALNVSINAASSSWDAIVQVPALLQDSSDTLYYVDGVHFTVLGAQTFAAAVDAAVDGI